MANANIGFLKRAQEFRSNVENRKYLPILDSLTEIASNHHNNLPASFFLERTNDSFVKEDLEFVIDTLYPNRKCFCRLIENSFFCIF